MDESTHRYQCFDVCKISAPGALVLFDVQVPLLINIIHTRPVARGVITDTARWQKVFDNEKVCYRFL